MSDIADAVRAAMFDARAWDELTAPTDTAREVQVVLGQMRDQLKVTAESKRATVSSVQAAYQLGQITAAEVTATQLDYASWRKRASGFSGMVDRRLAELATRFNKNEAEFQRRRATQSQHMWQALALAIYAHQSDDITDADLYGALDELRFTFGSKGDMTLRAALDAGLITRNWVTR